MLSFILKFLAYFPFIADINILFCIKKKTRLKILRFIFLVSLRVIKKQ